MDRVEKALEKRNNGYNCAQAVLCAFADDLGVSEDMLFRVSEAFGGGMGGTQSVCGAVSSMVALVGMLKSKGIDALPESNKLESYKIAGELMHEFEAKNGTVICSRLKAEGRRSCAGCVEDAIRIAERAFDLA